MRRFFRELYYSFPVQLLVLHIRSHHLLMGMWIVLFLMISGRLGAKFGLYYLFLEPEYLGNTSFWSYFILGLAFGCFFLTWNLTTYLLSAHHFPFLATLFHPFAKFCLNNFIVPLSFTLFFLVEVFLVESAYRTIQEQVLFVLAFLLGNIALAFLYFLYFHLTNRDISYHRKKGYNPPDQIKSIKPGRRDVDLDYIKKDDSRWKVNTYLAEFFKVRIVRSVAHYETAVLMNIFKQNHLNALVIQLVTIILLMGLGLLTDFPAFRLPAGASIFFLFSIITALIGALTYWLSDWVITSFIALVLLINFATRHDIGYHNNRAYGLNYQVPPAEYSLDRLEQITSKDSVAQDYQGMVEILEHWRAKNSTPRDSLPKLVLISTSGGGLTSATWVLSSLLKADSLLNGELLEHTALMTGASGGLLGAAYLREIKWRQAKGSLVGINQQEHIRAISQDMLNSISFMLVANDLSIPWTTFEYSGERYFKDRGYIFEKQLNENTDATLDKPLGAYRLAEESAEIPLLLATPSILNDGRMLYISTQPMSFMMLPPVAVGRPDLLEIDGADFQRIFHRQNPDSLRFLTALRMSATFPYILPSVHLPSTPEIQVMDAGFLDNYGLHASIRFVQVFKDWIKANTGGVILLQISSTPKIETIGTADKKGIITSLLGPIEMAGQLFTRQEFELDNNLGFLYDMLGEDYFQHVHFSYIFDENATQQKATISFHITEDEKDKIQNAFYSPMNQKSLEKLRVLLK
ncbi:MAG TPA: hypothetical protein VJ953_17975 [Saprospiraceae bacterium]|nr:hypothetical protein [Saprospiraceae bacterium]